MKKLIILGMAALVCLPGFGAAKRDNPQAGRKLKIVNVGITNDPATVSPLSVSNIMAYYASCILFMPLVSETSDRTFVYRLAESVVTEDNRTFKITLQRNVNWTDGTPVTADDVIFTMNTFSNPAVGISDPSIHRFIEGADDNGLFPAGAPGLSGVTKIDSRTLAVKTKYPLTLNVFNSNIGTNLRTIPKHILEKEKPESMLKSPFFQKPEVTNGPFKFKEYAPSQYLSLEANDAYFLGRPKIDMLNFKILTGQQIAAQLENGEIDMNYPGVGNIPADDYDRVMSLPHIATKRGEPGTVQVLFYNTEVLKQVKLRQAMDLAIDRDGILKNIFKGQAFVTKTPVSSQIEFWNEAAAKYAYDPVRAKALLAESGWDVSKKLTFLIPTGNNTRERVCAIIAENFKAIGLNIAIERADFPTTMGRIQKRDFDISIVGMPANPFDAARNLRYYAYSKDAYTGYVNPKTEALLETLFSSVDSGVLKSAYYEMQDILAEEVPVSGVYSELVLKAVNKRIIYGDIQDFGTLRDLEKWDIQQ
ncbi:MAG: peptide ABC transporter substrate-binding protein [Spirochaetaceae bacterium]|jgi:peptide/nickel transport system substrate-binding protein|nr:peptide ABC transporter substrate-binding protein [Spirochaetaceae bacterium]